jgi:hypothetical protein
MKNANRDNSLLPLCHQDTKKGKDLLVIGGGLHLIIFVRRHMSRPNAKAANSAGVSKP